ncbi:DUF3626 domain-containing protein [Isoptericola sediminis]|uniref:DUF3626 domain-containing protein n=1 Tax=Isoptericola sediminis TaxID=2733572 RepID=A0A849K7D2_9MICO|nr:DUF3626 domain-containing protein [Isoptericola sediminis]NNU27097.1 DUF3626 domain-containing protein [Isoptericola sediminis]
MEPEDERWRSAVEHVRDRAAGGPLPADARVVLHFHPDAPAGRGSVLETVAREGVYRSQFETRTSNGGLTAFPGGDRWRWESRIFGGVYDDAPPAARPRYGALLLDGDPYGAAPRFGSSYLRLGPGVLERTTLCYPDSAHTPDDFGTRDRSGLTAMLRSHPRRDPLDRYVEAHVHGEVRVDRDLEAVVLDPSYRGTAVAAAAERLGCAVEWHPGYRALPTAFDERYRGPEPVRLAESVAAEGELTPALLGPWRGADGVDPQTLKQVWHLLARYGRLSGALP